MHACRLFVPLGAYCCWTVGHPFSHTTSGNTSRQNSPGTDMRVDAPLERDAQPLD